MNQAVSTALSELAWQIGPGVESLGLEVELGSGHRLEADDLFLTVQAEPGGAVVFRGEREAISVVWTFSPWQGGYWVSLHVTNGSGQRVPSLCSLIVVYRPGADDLLDWRAPTLRGHLYVGMLKLGELPEEARSGDFMRGAFADSARSGIFLGTALPQSCLHAYRVEQLPENGLRFRCTTEFTDGLSAAQAVEAERTWICARQSLPAAMESYAAHLPLLDPVPELPVGWNSWDYYYSCVSLNDLIENLDEIKRDPLLSERVKYVVLDMGWYHTEGEWYPNYRFPGGLERMVDEIERRGFVPGIWTAPISVDRMSKTAWRSFELLVKDEYGDPAGEGSGWFMLDPTHPAGQAFLRELYTRLYEVGFRFFKVDYVSALLRARRFYDPTVGPYDALRALFGIIRECVRESHVLGCSLPEECGPGVVDSGRIGIDIHNQWTHVEWVVDNLCLKYWAHNRIWASDPDFLVVRGRDTSLEEETNVLNPAAHQPDPPRWRRGPVFTLDEARTWATIIRLSGGSVFLSDRLSMLNEAGKALIYPLLEPTSVSARPLDLGDAARPSLWLAQDAESSLGVINWSDTRQIRAIDWGALGLDAPDEVRDFWSGERLRLEQGRLDVTLEPHASALLCWTE